MTKYNTSNRKNYLDNLRTFCILFLFVYHTCMIYNGLIGNYYIHYAKIKIIDYFILFFNWWFMPLMFAIAGVSAFYALQKRTNKEFLNERIFKLLIPFLFASVFVVPIIAYLAEISHNGVFGSFFYQYLLYFTKIIDFTGFSGGYTPAHMWFVETLFAISVISLPTMRYFLKIKSNEFMKNMKLPVIYLHFIFPLAFTPVLFIFPYSIGQNSVTFLLGFMLLSDEHILYKLKKKRWLCTAIALVSMLMMYYIFYNIGYESKLTLKTFIFFIFDNFTMWSCIIAIFGQAQQILNKTNRVLKYLSSISFKIYIFHHIFILLIAYFIVNFTQNIPLQFIVIMSLSIPLTLMTCEVVVRVPILNFLFGGKIFNF